MKAILIAILLTAPALADDMAKLDVVTAQTITTDDPFGHTKKAECGRYRVHAPSGASIGLAQFVFSAGTLLTEGEPGFPSAWEHLCRGA